MKKQYLIYSFQLTCVVVYFLLFCSADGSLSQPKRINNQQRLFPFPRIGRSGENTWDFNPESTNNRKPFVMMGYPQVISPAVDATDFDESQHFKRSEKKNIISELWFGPRLGRLHKRNMYMFDNFPRRFLLSPEESEVVNQQQYAARLGRLSDEILDDDVPSAMSVNRI